MKDEFGQSILSG